ncbi:MATE family efflux transporter [Acetobacterium tundrae]|uniref:Probable multidrug resistance protein NorM n=1 Tax=Acetobacterium tundrae TaxID=132932 RepID=A0ABR6WQ06_9FIRM|nr:MATE family efflux transporter [Acetobacterium tundrae]MBC3798554.1 MATE family efflux transporter [Acetobacterium tundrae]
MVAAIAIPITLQSLITIGVNMTDTLMVGSLGEMQLSAASLANQFIMIFQICCMGIGMGASVLTSRFWGMRDLNSLRKTVTVMLRICLMLSLVFSLATFFAPEMIMGIYTTDSTIIQYGARYFKWSVPCYALLGLSLTSTIVLRSVGQVRLPLFSSIGAFLINIFFNYLFIFGNFGAPQMGIEGSALSTLIARIFEFSFICGYLFFIDKRIRYRLGHLFLRCRDISKEYFQVAIPVLVSDALLAFGNSAVTMVIGRLGVSFVSANAITMVTQQLSTVFIQGISNASAIMTGHTLGRGDQEKAQQQGVTFLYLGLAVGVFGALLIWLISKPMISCYNITEETQQLTSQLMFAVGFIVIFQSTNSILTKGVLRGGGDTQFLMVADIIFLWVASIPLGALAGLVWHLPAFWIYTLLKIDQIIKSVWCIYRLRSKKWIKKIESYPLSENQ